MTTNVAPASAVPTTAGETKAPSMWRTGLKAGVIAAVATTAIAAVASAVDVPLEIGGESLPMIGFAQLTLFFTALGVLIAKGLARWTQHPRTAFVRTTVALTALSFVPDLTADATSATKVTLMLTHLVAAAIVIPALANRLDR
jgi:hypothetical protein